MINLTKVNFKHLSGLMPHLLCDLQGHLHQKKISIKIYLLINVPTKKN